MMKLSLGRKRQSCLPNEKKEQLAWLFSKGLRASYIKKLALYTDEEALYDSPVRIKKRFMFRHIWP